VLEFLRRNRVLLVSGCFLVMAATLVLRTGGGRSRTDALGSVLLELLAPVQRVVAGVGESVASVWRGAGDLWSARREVVVLRARVQSLEEAATQSQEIELENDRLRQMLGLRDRLTGHVLAARVIARDASMLSHTLVIDRGTTDGVDKGAAVLAPDGVVGQIFQTSPHAARVLLVTDHNSGVDGLVQRSRVRGIVEGTLDGGLGFRFAKRTDDVQVGDRIVTSGLDGIFPKGLSIGVVAAVDKRGQSLFQAIEVAPAVDVGRLEEVTVTLGTVAVAERPPAADE